MNGALLINKNAGVSSFGIIEVLQEQLLRAGVHRRDLPKLGHGGTLDPFATGLLIVLVGRGVKLARYFLGATKQYQGVIRFGETTVPGDPTAPISETSDHVPASLAEIQDLARRLTLQPYLQIPPMHSAKKRNGKPLYELARAGIEVDRDPKLCHLYEFEIPEYQAPKAQFRLKCSSGTYVRTLAQDLGKLCNSVGMLDTLHRTQSGAFLDTTAMTTDQILEADKPWDQLPCWMPFDQLLRGYPRSEATYDEKQSLIMGQQSVIFNLLKRAQAPVEPAGIGAGAGTGASDECVAIYHEGALVAIARKAENQWGLERVFT